MAEWIKNLRDLEGRQVCLALADGSRIDDCSLVSAGRRGATTVWVFANGSDAFIPRADIVAAWGAGTLSRPAA
jgi:hypothetical protein